MNKPRNQPTSGSPYGYDPYLVTGRKRTRESAAQRRQSVADSMTGAQQTGNAGGGGIQRGDAGYWQRKQRYAAAARRARRRAGAQVGPGGIRGSKSRRRSR